MTSLALPLAIRDEWAEVSGCRHFVEESFTRSIDAVTARINVGEAVRLFGTVVMGLPSGQ